MIDKWKAGYTRRWHHNSDMSSETDYISEHQNRCVILLISLWPDASRNLILSTATHDMQEYVCGDLGRPFKQKGGLAVSEHKKVEEKVQEEMGYNFQLTDLEKKKMGFVDYLDAYLFAMHKKPFLSEKEGWKSDRTNIYKKALELGVEKETSELFKGVFN